MAAKASTGGDEPEFVPVQKKRAFEEIIVQFEEMILAGRLKAGDRLPNERSLSEMLGVSRPSLREALRVFEALELIEVRPGVGAASGSTVRSEAGNALTGLLRMHLALGHFSVRELVEVRRTIEHWTVRAAAEQRTDEDLAQLGAILERMESETDGTAFRRLDAQFHTAIAVAAGNGLMARLMEALRDPIVYQITDRLPAESPVDSLRWIVPEHRRILAAIKARRPTAAARAMADHLKFYDD